MHRSILAIALLATSAGALAAEEMPSAKPACTGDVAPTGYHIRINDRVARDNIDLARSLESPVGESKPSGGGGEVCSTGAVAAHCASSCRWCIGMAPQPASAAANSNIEAMRNNINHHQVLLITNCSMSSTALIDLEFIS